MEREEKIKKLMDKTGASYEDAAKALNACQEDILDAVLYLEALGKVKPAAGTASSAGSAENNASGSYISCGQSAGNGGGYTEKKPGNSFAAGLGKILRAIGRLIEKGMVNYLDIYKDGNCVFSIPLTILVVLFIPFFWFMTVVLVVFLFVGCRYQFRGPDCDKDGKANQVLNKASDTCTSVKDDFRRGYNGTDGNGCENNGQNNSPDNKNF